MLEAHHPPPSLINIISWLDRSGQSCRLQWSCNKSTNQTWRVVSCLTHSLSCLMIRSDYYLHTTLSLHTAVREEGEYKTGYLRWRCDVTSELRPVDKAGLMAVRQTGHVMLLFSSASRHTTRQFFS